MELPGDVPPDPLSGRAPADGFGSAARRPRQGAVVVGAFWLSIVAIPASTAVVVVVLSRLARDTTLSRTGIVLALALVASVVPIAIQSGTAAEVARGGAAPTPPWRAIVVVTVLGVAASAPLGLAIDVPPAVIALPALALAPGVGVGSARGALIGDARLLPVAANNAVEVVARLVLGVGLGVVAGAPGLALGGALATVGAWVVVAKPRTEGRLDVPRVLVATALVSCSVQVALLISRRAFGDSAEPFAAAALLSQSVFLALTAVGWIAVGRALQQRTLLGSLGPVAVTIVVGVVGAVALTVVAPALGTILDEPAVSRSTVLGLALGMAVAAGNWTALQVRLVRSDRGLWPGPLAAVVLPVVASAAGDEALVVGSVIVGQLAALGASTAGLRRELRRHAERVPTLHPALASGL